MYISNNKQALLHQQLKYMGTFVALQTILKKFLFVHVNLQYRGGGSSLLISVKRPQREKKNADCGIAMQHTPKLHYHSNNHCFPYKAPMSITISHGRTNQLHHVCFRFAKELLSVSLKGMPHLKWEEKPKMSLLLCPVECNSVAHMQSNLPKHKKNDFTLVSSKIKTHQSKKEKKSQNHSTIS